MTANCLKSVVTILFQAGPYIISQFMFLFINTNVLVVTLGTQYDLFSLYETQTCFVEQGITQAEGNICSC